MKYLDKQKDWKYYIKSSAITFLSVFLPIFATLVASYDLSGIDIQQINASVVMSGAITIVRLIIFSSLLAIQKIIVKFKK